ncbi:MAG: hypothetical protein DDT28_01086 [Dehalococcoidia bacterium]|nr:hypothetical protein [Chloroflexota bacterium]
MACGGISCPENLNVLSGHALHIEIYFSPDDLAGRKIAIFNSLRHVIFVNRLTKVFEIIGSNFFILPALLLRTPSKRARGCREPNLNSFWVSSKHSAPFPPGASMALINDDMAEIILGIVLQKEFGIFGFTGHIKRLVSCNQDSGVFLWV